MKIKHIAINNILLSEVRGLETAYKMPSTSDAMRVCYTIGLTKYTLLKARDDNDRGIKDLVNSLFPIANRDNIQISITNNPRATFQIFIDDSALMLIKFIKADFPAYYSFSRIYSYLVYLGINEIINNGLYYPSQHINYDVDKNNILREL